MFSKINQILNNDGVIAFVTDTVWGLGCLPTSEKAVQKIYEIKHSKEVVPQQCKHLLDEQKCKDTEFRYGTITGKYVIYRGVTTSLVQAGVETQEDVAYLNVEEYLKGLG